MLKAGAFALSVDITCVCAPAGRGRRERRRRGSRRPSCTATFARLARPLASHRPLPSARKMSGATSWSSLLTAAPRRRCLCRARESARLRACASGESGAAEQLRRRAVSLLLGGLCSVALAGPVVATTSPYNDTAVEVGLVQGHLRNCPSTFNCVSTAAKSSDQYAGPWSAANEASPSIAAELIITAVQAIEPRAVLVTSEAVAAPEGHYVRLQLPGAFDLTDELEFYLLREQSASRADNGNVLVTFRSCAGGVKCACPWHHPLTCDACD
jgi:uncharacterized protein (DUF1499 family)